MANKRKRLIDSAVASVRTPSVDRLRTEQPKTGYRVVAVSLYTPEADWVDQLVRTLRAAGYRKPNRSLIIQEAIARLQEDLPESSQKATLDYFSRRQTKRRPQAST